MVENCEVLNYEGTCKKCKEQYYLDENSNCIQIFEDSLIDFCQEYISVTECFNCDPGYYIEEGICKKPINFIDNCILYESDEEVVDEETNTDTTTTAIEGEEDTNTETDTTTDTNTETDTTTDTNTETDTTTDTNTETDTTTETPEVPEVFRTGGICKTCSHNHRISSDKKTCTEIKIKSNCLLQKRTKCMKCKSGYQMNKNNYFKEIFDFQKKNQGQQFFEIKEEIEHNPFTKEYNFPSCQIITLPNCSLVDSKDFSKCLHCNTFYFLDDSNKCQLTPLEPIPNCNKYQNESACTHCHENFYLKSSNKCDPIEEIENCKKYKTNSSSIQCDSCENNYYISSGSCVDRIDSLDILNCRHNNSNADTCIDCQIGFKLSIDKKSCLRNVVHCQLYSTATNCQICDSGFYLDVTRNVCLVGTKENCLRYSANSNICEQCIFQYYLLNGICYKHRELQQCDQYSETQKNMCNDCQSPYLLFSINNSCIEQLKIDNCENQQIINSSLQCTECSDGYILNNSGQCQLNDDNNCRKLDGNEDCIECKGNLQYMPFTKKCKDPFQYVTPECEQFGGSSFFTCQTCKPEAYPFSLSKFDVCLETSYEYFQRIPFCERYQFNNTSLECVGCAQPFFYTSSSKQCSTICSDSKIILELEFDTASTELKSMNSCKAASASFSQCDKIIQSNNPTNENFVCVTCKDNDTANMPLPHIIIDSQTQTTLKSHITYFSRVSSQYHQFHEQLTAHPVECGHSTTDAINYNIETQTDKVTNFDLYEHVLVNSINLYKCIRCKVGYTGVTKAGYIETCGSSITDCNTSKEVLNLLSPFVSDSVLNKEPLTIYASCFACSKEKLPVIYMSKDTSRLNYEELEIEGEAIFHQKCLKNEYQSFNLLETDVYDTVVANCGYIWYVTNLTLKADISDVGTANIRCAACKTGHKPTYTTEVITACTPIAECDSIVSGDIEIFNSCHRCKKGFNFKYDKNSKIYDYTECVAETVPSCKVYDADNTVCLICQDGYSKNPDGECDLITIPQCKSFSNSSHPYSTSGNLRRNIFLASLGNGCTSCNNDFSQLQLTSPICQKSTTLSNTLSQTTNFIKNCEKYQNSYQNSNFKCEMCQQGFVIKQDKTECLINSNLQGCNQASSSNTCLSCEGNKILLNGICAEKTIDKCQQYNENVGTLTCQKCQGHYYLQNNTCHEGYLPGCDMYDSETICQQCKSGFVLISLSGNTYCYPMPEGTKCSEYTTSEFENQELICSQCKSGYQLTTNEDDFSSQICLQFNIISHCEEYHISNNLSTSTLECMRCEREYFIEDKYCHSREHVDDHCVSFSNSEDKCNLCSSGYFLTSDQKECKDYPYGIFGCLSYLNISTCGLCQENKYLKENQCLELLEEEKVENCMFYGESKQCSFCVQNFFLKDASCVAIEAQNCQEIENEKTCKSCQFGFGLEKVEELTNCVEKNVTNCVLSTDVSPYECIVCENGYFLNEEKVCQQVTVPIDGCEQYQGEEVCGLCEEDKILSLNGKVCDDIENVDFEIDYNCYSFKEMEENQCEICKFGYFFDLEETCVECEENKFEEGCMSCNPYNQSECYLCRDGFYQEEWNGECIQYIFPPVLEVKVEAYCGLLMYFVMIVGFV